MTNDEFTLLRNMKKTIHVNDLKNTNLRRLIQGYTLNLEGFEVCLERDPSFGWRVFGLYVGNQHTNLGRETSIDLCVPDKRVYPSESDYEFCQILMDKGVFIPFYTFRE